MISTTIGLHYGHRIGSVITGNTNVYFELQGIQADDSSGSFKKIEKYKKKNSQNDIGYYGYKDKVNRDSKKVLKFW